MLGYAIMTGLFVAFLASAGYGLWWATMRGQLSDVHRGATAIFDADEPQGEITDGFPAGGDEPRK